jgi:uncharacterized protein YneF (UPF0154 family)
MRTLALLTIAFASTAASAGVYIESSQAELGVKPAPAPTVSKIWFDGGRMRSNDGSGDGAIFKDQKIYALDAQKKTYSVVDKAAMDRMGGQLAEARKKMEAQMANMPPERRAMMEQMMSQMGGGAAGAMQKAVKRDVTATGRTQTVGGFKCTVWEVALDGVKDQELCAAPAGSLPGGSEVLKTMREMGEMMKGLTAGLGGMAKRTAADAWSDLAKINGVPILTRDFEDGKATSETRLSVIRSESVPGSTFEVPAGFKERKMPQMGAGGEE